MASASASKAPRTAPAHVLRPAAPTGQQAKRSAAKAAATPTVYPPGYFTELCRKNNWPYAGWQPVGLSAAEELHLRRSAAGHANSRAAVDAGQLTSISLLGSLDSAPALVARLRNWRPK